MIGAVAIALSIAFGLVGGASSTQTAHNSGPQIQPGWNVAARDSDLDGHGSERVGCGFPAEHA